MLKALSPVPAVKWAWRGSRIVTWLALLAAAALHAGTDRAAAQCVEVDQAQRLSNDDPVGDRFGDVLAISGNTLAVGNRVASFPVSTLFFRVSIFTRADDQSPWVSTAVLEPTSGGLASATDFGSSIALEGTTLVIGASGEKAVYVFTGSGSTWTLQQKIQVGASIQGLNTIRFGSEVDVSGNNLIIGDQTGNGNNGYAAVYVRSGSTWSLQQVLTPPAADMTDRFFGRAVAISGATVAVSRFTNLTNSFYWSGEVSVFTRSGSVWTLQRELRPITPVAEDQFGYALSLAGEVLLVGAPGYPVQTPAIYPGAAYVFKRTGSLWTQSVKLQPSDGVDDYNFGCAVSLASESYAAVGASDRNPGQSGGVYTFKLVGTTWQGEHIITPAGTPLYERFGGSVGANGFGTRVTIVGGSPQAGDPVNAGAVYSFTATTAGWTENQRIIEPVNTGNVMGGSVAIAGDYAVAGSAGDNRVGLNSGSAQVFYKTTTGWQLISTLTGPGESSAFGAAVSISPDATTIAVGAPYDGDNNAGAVWVFTRSGSGTGATWPVQQIIRASDFNSNDHFGASVSVLGNRLVVGAPEDNNAEGVDAGSAYVYTRSSGVWGGQFRISPSQLEAGDQFGVSVGIVSSNRIVVGAYGDNTGALNNSGAAYIFDSQLQVFPNPPIWVVSEVLIPTDVASGDNFGYSLAVSGNVVVVGSLLDDNGGGVDAGSAYVFTYTEFPPALRGWDAGVKLLSGGNDPDDQFGFSVAIEGEVIVVGVPNDDNAGGPNAGTAVVYKKFPGAGWSEQVRFAAPDAAAGDYFGVSVAISGGNLVAGSFGDDNATGVDAGSVYAFDLTVNPPVFLGPPASVAACPGGQASFTAAYVESGLRLYSWRRNGVQLSNQSGHIAGAQSETLIITGVTAADAGEYTCVVTNACGATTSAAAQLTLNAADFNCTGGTTIQDIFDFLAAYFGNNPSADFNGSGGVTVQDIFDFLSAYFGG